MFKQLCVLAFVATAFVTDWSVEQAAASVSGKTYVAVFAPTTTQYEFQTSGVFIEPNFRGTGPKFNSGVTRCGVHLEIMDTQAYKLETCF